MALSAIAEVAEKAARQVPKTKGLHVLMSLPETRPGFSENDAQYVVHSVRQNVRAPSVLDVEVAGRGHAGVVDALRVAAQRLAKEDAGLYVVCGTESYLDDDTLEWLDGQGRLTRKGNRSGFVPGEAAGALLLAGDATLRQMSAPAPSLALVRGIGIATESKLVSGDDGCLGEGLAKAITEAATPLRLPDEALDDVYCDINGERYRTEEWGLALLRTQRVFKTTDYQFASGSWGDVGAAAGALGCVLAVQAWRRGHSAGPRALVCAGSEGGLRGAAVLEQRAQKDAGAW